MQNLLSSNFSRLFKSTLFYFFCISVFLVTFLNNWDGFYTQKYLLDVVDRKVLESYFYSSAPLFGAIQAVLCAVFIGSDYTNGAIRNKFIVGYTRKEIYIANFLTMCVAGFVFIGLWYVAGIENLLLIYDSGNILNLLLYLLIIVLFTTALSAIYIAVAMNTDKMYLSIILNLGIWLVLLYAAIRLNSDLEIPEMAGGMSYIDGQFVLVEETPNPLYISGTLRNIYETLLEILPTGNAILLTDLNIVHPFQMIIYQAIISLVSFGAGLSIFKNKDIK